MKSIKQFIVENKIRLESEMVDSNPYLSEDTWQAYHYKVTLFHRRRQYTTYYSMGMGLSREPEVDDVLDCMSSDCSMIENATSFEDWAADLGYDEDSRKAEKTFKACKEQTRKMLRLLGPSLYDELLYDTERL